jgi:osmoprotectant transport system ATP-binding protein
VSLSLVAAQVTVAYAAGRAPALRAASLEVLAGTCVALVGESGSGKTTLLRCFNRMVAPDSGEVRVGERDVRDQDPIALRRQLGYVQQRGGLVPHWTVRQNVGLVLRASGGGAERVRADEALLLVGMDPDEFGHRLPHQLSGGQAQRVALARALAAQPQAILLDEPFGALDAITRAEVQSAFHAARLRLKLTALLVTHDLADAARLADEIAVMRHGMVEQRGTIAQLRDAPATEYVRDLVAGALAQLRALERD